MDHQELRRLREAAGLSQQAMGLALKRSQKHVSRVENDLSRLAPGEQKRWETTCDVAVENREAGRHPLHGLVDPRMTQTGQRRGDAHRLQRQVMAQAEQADSLPKALRDYIVSLVEELDDDVQAEIPALLRGLQGGTVKDLRSLIDIARKI